MLVVHFRLRSSIKMFSKWARKMSTSFARAPDVAAWSTNYKYHFKLTTDVKLILKIFTSLSYFLLSRKIYLIYYRIDWSKFQWGNLNFTTVSAKSWTVLNNGTNLGAVKYEITLLEYELTKTTAITHQKTPTANRIGNENGHIWLISKYEWIKFQDGFSIPPDLQYQIG